MWCRRPPVRRVTVPAAWTRSGRTRAWGAPARAPGAPFGRAWYAVAGVARRARDLCGRRWLYSSVNVPSRAWSWAIVAGWGAWARSHFVLLGHAEAAQLVLQPVAAAFPAGEPGGEDHAVVGQR